MKTLSILTLAVLFLGMAVTQDGYRKTGQEPTYVGSDACTQQCHSGLALVAEYLKSGHPYKLNEVNGAPPAYPTNTSPGVMKPPGTEWTDFSYVIGGYGWKARFVKPDGRIYTVGDSAQYNLPDAVLGRDESWAPYNKGQDRKYNYGCFQCHTTGATPEGSWNGVAADSLGMFNEPGIRCEGCHGPGSDHVAGAFMNPRVLPPITGDDLRINRCGDCHQRGGITNAIPVSGGYIRHHEQLNEMRASAHGDGVGDELTCAKCHNPHVALRYPDAAGPGENGISEDCQSCHDVNNPAKYVVQLNGADKPIDCVDCHMPRATKSAVGFQLGNGWQGDVRTHIWGINTSAVTKDVGMFTADGSQVALDGEGHGAVTLDFACLQCHTDKDVTWAANFASAVHSAGIVTGTEGDSDLPSEFALGQNYPNPFNPSTTIEFSVPQTSQVTITVYDAAGRLLGTVVDNLMPAGQHSVTIQGDGLASGMYFYEMKAGDHNETKSMIVMK